MTYSDVGYFLVLPTAEREPQLADTRFSNTTLLLANFLIIKQRTVFKPATISEETHHMIFLSTEFHSVVTFFLR